MKQVSYFILFLSILILIAAKPKKDFLKAISRYEGFVITRHMYPFHSVEKRIWKDSLKVLKTDVEAGINDNTALVRLLRINAMLNEEHTTVNKRTPYAPIKCLKYKEGVFVIATSPDLMELLGARLLEIESVPCDSIIEKVNELIPGNESWKNKRCVEYLVNIDILKGFGVAKSDTVMMKFEKDNKVIESKIYHHKFSTWSQIMYSQIMLRFESSRNYWYKFIENDKIIYMAYNRCREDKFEKANAFFRRLADETEKKQPKKFILDLRGNSGGNPLLLKPLIDGLAKGRLARDKGIFILTGSSTFSAAIHNAYDLRTKANAIIIGQMTGGNLNHYGGIKTEKLMEKLYLTYSTKLYQPDTSAHGGIIPDIIIEPSFENRVNGIDECLKAAIEY